MQWRLFCCISRGGLQPYRALAYHVREGSLNSVVTLLLGEMSADKKEHTPSEEEITAFVLDLWKQEPETTKLGMAKLLGEIKKRNTTWALSEKRFKSVMKQQGLQNGTQQPAGYVTQTVSQLTPGLNMPPGVQAQMTKGRGKSLYSTKGFLKDEHMWSEEPLVIIPLLECVGLMRKGLACAYCSRPFQRSAESRTKTECPRNCGAEWCNSRCRKRDIIHSATWHSPNVGQIDQRAWQRFEDFTIESQWAGGYGFGIVLLNALRDPSKNHRIAKQVASMAKVRQDTRLEATGQLEGLAGELQEQMLEEGHKLLAEAVKNVHELSYEDFLYGVGRVNINNLDTCLFITQSHLNHSCDPNVKVDVIGRVAGIKVTAKREIRPNEELLTCYVNPSLPVDERQRLLKDNWGFVCKCDRCKREEEALKHPQSNGGTACRPRRKSVRFDSEVQVSTM